MQPSGAGTDEGHIAHPALVRALSVELSAHQILRYAFVPAGVVRDLGSNGVRFTYEC
jgi:hypothetical protein